MAKFRFFQEVMGADGRATSPNAPRRIPAPEAGGGTTILIPGVMGMIVLAIVLDAVRGKNYARRK